MQTAAAFSVAPSHRPSTLFAPGTIHPHRAHDALLAEVDAIEVDDQNLPTLETPAQQLLQRRFGGFDRFPADVGFRDPAVSAIAGSTARV